MEDRLGLVARIAGRDGSHVLRQYTLFGLPVPTRMYLFPNSPAGCVGCPSKFTVSPARLRTLADHARPASYTAEGQAAALTELKRGLDAWNLA
jgi:hypothetical protein